MNTDTQLYKKNLYSTNVFKIHKPNKFKYILEIKITNIERLTVSEDEYFIKLIFLIITKTQNN